MTFYNWIKITHIVTGSIVFITLINAFIYWFIVQKNNNLAIQHQAIHHIRTATWASVIPFGIVQILTGFTMLSLKHYHLSELWIKGIFISIILLFISWFSFVQTLIKIQLSPQTNQPNPTQYVMFALCVTSLCGLVFFMATKIA